MHSPLRRQDGPGGLTDSGRVAAWSRFVCGWIIEGDSLSSGAFRNNRFFRVKRGQGRPLLGVNRTRAPSHLPQFLKNSKSFGGLTCATIKGRILPSS